MSSIFNRFRDDPDGLNIYEAVVQRSPIGILILDPDGAVVSANEAWSTMTGFSSAETVGGRLMDFVSAKDSEIVRIAIRQKSSSDTLQVLLKLKSGDMLNTELILHTVRTEKAPVMNFVAYTGPVVSKRESEVYSHDHRHEVSATEDDASRKKLFSFDMSRFLGEHWQAILTTVGAGLTFVILIGVQFTTMQDRVQRQEQTIEKIQTMLEKLVSEQADAASRKPPPKQGS